MGKITRIEQQKKKKNRVNIYIDGDFYSGLYKDTVIKFHLYENKEITPSEIDQIKEFEDFAAAKEKAINYISYRERSKKEIEDYLKNKEIEEVIIQKVLSDLEKADLVNNQKFASTWVKDRNKNNPKGNFALKMELKEKGINDSEIEKILQSVRKYGKKKNAKEKISQYLQRRGFHIQTILEVLREEF
ncbi:MAG: RecX family transcriptional regulator [candidate division WOR-3 bacterium]